MTVLLRITSYFFPAFLHFLKILHWPFYSQSHDDHATSHYHEADVSYSGGQLCWKSNLSKIFRALDSNFSRTTSYDHEDQIYCNTYNSFMCRAHIQNVEVKKWFYCRGHFFTGGVSWRHVSWEDVFHEVTGEIVSQAVVSWGDVSRDDVSSSWPFCEGVFLYFAPYFTLSRTIPQFFS